MLLPSCIWVEVAVLCASSCKTGTQSLCLTCKEIHDQAFTSPFNVARLLSSLHGGIEPALCVVSRCGKIDVIVQLLEKFGADARLRNDEPLRLAAENSHGDLVQLLVEKYGADVRSSKHAPLRAAAGNGDGDLVQLLVGKYGADIHTCDDAPLRAAVRHGHVRMVDLLCGSYGANVRAMLGWEAMPIITAVYRGQTAMVELLCARYGALEPPTAIGIAAYAVEAPNKVEMLDLLCIRFGADARCEQEHPLRLAAAMCHPESVRVLCEVYGADVHAQEDEALRMAARAKDFYVKEEDVLDPTTRACIIRDTIETIDILCSKGADVHARGGEALRNAARCGVVEIVKLLCERYGANRDDPEAIAAAASTIDEMERPPSPVNNNPFVLTQTFSAPYMKLVSEGCAAVIEYLRNGG